MKILYATMQFARGYAQGTERYVAMLAEGMSARGHEVAILAGDPERRGPAMQLGAVVQDRPRVLFYPSSGWMSVQGMPPSQLREFLDRERPDLVHVANPAHIGTGLMEAARAAGIPVVVTIMDFWWLCPKHTLFHASGRTCDANVTWRECIACMGASDSRGWVRAMARTPVIGSALLPAMYFGRAKARGCGRAEIGRWKDRQRIVLDELRQANAVIFPSWGARERLGMLVEPARAHSIPYGLERRWFESRVSRGLKRGGCPQELVIGFAGALAPHKGLHLLLEAIRKLGWNKTRVRIAGGGTDTRYADRLRELARGMNVEFVGRLDSAKMPAFLGGLDLFVMPSIWPENLPIVVLETQAVGVPVMASDIDGIREAVPESMRFENGSAASLARRLAEWAEDPVNAGSLQAVSTAEEMVDRTAGVYEVANRP